MAKTLLGGSYNSSIGINVTRWGALSSGRIDTTATEAMLQFKHKTALTITDLSVYVSANGMTTANVTARVRKNGANGSNVVSVAAGTTGHFTDPTHSDSIAVNDLVAFSWASDNSGSGTATMRTYTAVASAASGTLSIFGSSNAGGISVSASGATNYVNLSGDAFVQATEAQCQGRYDAAGTLQNAYAYVDTNMRATTTTIRVRKNGANGNGALSIGSLATGAFQDATNTDTIAAADLVCLSITTGVEATAIVFRLFGAEFSAAGNAVDVLNQYFSSIGGSATPTYCPLMGAITWNADATLLRNKLHYQARLSKLKVYVHGNTVNAAVTVASYIDGAAGNQSLSIPTSTSGAFQDASNSDVVSATSDVQYKAVGGTSGSMINDMIGMMVAEVVVTPRSLAEGMDYRVKTAPAPVAEAVRYAVRQTVPATEALRYAVKASPAGAASPPAQYAVKSPQSTSKGADYRVRTPGAPLTGALRYAVKWLFFRFANIDYKVKKARTYGVAMFYYVRGTNTPTQPMTYRVRVPKGPQTAGMDYRVTTPGTPAARTLAYAVRAAGVLVASMAYRVRTAGAASKGMEYRVANAAAPVAEPMAYRVTTPAPEVATPIRYAVRPTAGIALPSKYTVISGEAPSKELIYRMRTGGGQSKEMRYVVDGVAHLTLGMKYTVPAPPAVVAVGMRYVIRVFPYAAKPGAPFTRMRPPGSNIC